MRAPLLGLLLWYATLRSSAGLRARLQEEGEVHVATSACGKYCLNALGLTRTLFAQARLDGGPKPHLHVFHDGSFGSMTWCGQELQNFKANESALFEAGELHLHDASEMIGSSSADLWKRCNSLRVYFPRMLPQLHKMMYIDSDAIVVSSLLPLWRMNMSVYMIGEDGANSYWYPQVDHCPKWRNGSLILTEGRCHPFKHGVNAGVYLIDLDKWRARNLDDEFDAWLLRMSTGEAQLQWHEQDIFNLVSVQHPEYMTKLPCEANSMSYNRWMCYYGTGSYDDYDSLSASRNSRQPIILHSKFGLRVHYQQWVFLREQVMQAVSRVARGQLGDDRSLCGMAACGSMIAEAMYSDECLGGLPQMKKLGRNCTPRPSSYIETSMDDVLDGTAP